AACGVKSCAYQTTVARGLHGERISQLRPRRYNSRGSTAFHREFAQLVTPIQTAPHERHDTSDGAAAVVAHVREMIDRGAVGPGGRLPPERELAQQVGVSRPTVRAGLRTLAALGVVRSRRGSGTYIPQGPPTLGAEALSFLAALHKFTVDDVYEARRILEVGAAGLAAERATPEQLATLADEVAGLFASLTERQVFLVHDINFHRSIAAASANPIVASLVEMVASLYYERRRTTA